MITVVMTILIVTDLIARRYLVADQLSTPANADTCNWTVEVHLLMIQFMEEYLVYEMFVYNGPVVQVSDDD